MPSTPTQAVPQSLDQLLRREDIWRGRRNRSTSAAVVDTGHAGLNGALLRGGWPLGALVEVCQQRFQGEWQLFLPALLALAPGLIVLLNPPAEPFSQALIQAGMDLERLVVVRVADKDEFLAGFSELVRTGACGAVLGWQPGGDLRYTELRKCLLAAAGGAGLYALFRPPAAQRQSSPALLRLFCRVVPAGLEVTVFKQKGVLQRSQPKSLVLPLPAAWQAAPSYPDLGRPTRPGEPPVQTADVTRLGNR